MEEIPLTVFDLILIYATNDKRLLRSVVSWERVSKKISARLMHEFWLTVPARNFYFYKTQGKECSMMIEWDDFNSIDMRALISVHQRGIRRSYIIFDDMNINFPLPLGLADSVPFPISIRLGRNQNYYDPELLRMLQRKCNDIEEIHFYTTNPTINDAFIRMFKNLKSLRRLTLFSFAGKRTPSAKARRMLFTELSQLSLQCLCITSSSQHSYSSIFDEELFTMLENQRVQCLHLVSINHYVERWLANSHLHNRAKITNLCINNDQFCYYPCEEENFTSSSLFHTLANYVLLFPNLKFACIALVQFDNSLFDSMLLGYYLNNSFNIQVQLTIRLFHNLEVIPSERFDWVLNELKLLQAEITFTRESAKDAFITITSKEGSMYTEIIVCFSDIDPRTWTLHSDNIAADEQNNCVDQEHYGFSTQCLCASNY